MMTHSKALNEILSRSCGLDDLETIKANGGYQRFRFDICCNTVMVHAKQIAPKKYAIIKISFGDETLT